MAQELLTTFEAVYENGALKPKVKLDLVEGEEVLLGLVRSARAEEFLRDNPCFAPDPGPGGPTDLSERAEEYLYGRPAGSDD